MQQRLGVAERMAAMGRRVVRSYMPDQHRAFFEQLPFLVAGTVDGEGNPWATFLTGKPGFARSPDPHTLQMNVRRAPDDPAWQGIQGGEAVGLLGIELHTRRRNRLNGVLLAADDAHPARWELKVHHSFGNCPQYIQRRALEVVDDTPRGEGGTEKKMGNGRESRVRVSTELMVSDRAMIAAADTFHVASYVDLDVETSGGIGNARQVDVSHRGGQAGFVRVGEDGRLTIPDFAGNLHFNTLGNFLENPRAGLIFVDFQRGDVLQMTGRAEVLLEGPEIDAFEGAERLWYFTPERVVFRKAALGLRWRLLEWSPNSLMTGSWTQVEQRIEAERHRHTWRPFTVTQVVQESAVIRSLHLRPANGEGTLRHQAGQHLPIRVEVPGHGLQHRVYTLSVAPSDAPYRISVKEEGLVSTHLHRQVKVGDCIEALAPAGNFTIDALEREREAVLLAAGVGITPLLAMLRHVVFEGQRTRRTRPTTLVYAAQNRSVRAFDEEIEALRKVAQGAVRVVRVVSAPGPEEVLGRTHDFEGFVSPAVLAKVLPDLSRRPDAYDFYLCGPPPFMQSVYDGVRAAGVADGRIHAEAFGPASLTRRLDPGSENEESTLHASMKAASVKPVRILFGSSKTEAQWEPAGPDLLTLAESMGLQPAFGCRIGACGACKVPVRRGQVVHRGAPTYPVGPDEALLCCALPAEGRDFLEIEG